MNKPVITYFYRKPNVNFSIERVFDTVLLTMSSYAIINKFCVKYHQVTLTNILKNILFCLKHKGNINHITGDIHYCALLLPSKKTILTVHDLVGMDSNAGIKKVLFFFLWYYLPVRRSAIVTCISETTKKALLKIVSCDEEKVKVVYNPISDDYHYVYREFNKSKPVILHIGTRVNKNVERVIEALKDVPCTLRIIGELTDYQIQLLKNNSIEYTNAFNLTDAQIVQEYINCDIVSFPSTYEGFGMPIIEGQATGRVVLTSNIEPMIEIANGTAFLTDPYNVDSIRKSFIRLIEDESLRCDLIQLGLQNVKRFSATEIAKQYFSIYNELSKL